MDPRRLAVTLDILVRVLALIGLVVIFTCGDGQPNTPL